MVLYSHPSENELDKSSNKVYTCRNGIIFSRKTPATLLSPPHFVMMQCAGLRLLSSKSIIWSDKPSVEFCCRRSSILLRLMFDSDTMGVGCGLGLSKDLKMGQ